MNIFEVVSFLSGVISVYLTVKQNIWCWLFGIISGVFLIFTFIQVEFYGQIILQTVCLVQCVEGWLKWKKNDSNEIKKTETIKLINHIFQALSAGLLFVILTHNNNIGLITIIESVGGFIGVLATYYLTIKHIEAWWLYMVNNMIMVCLGLSSGLYMVSSLNLILFLMSIIGYISWKKNIKTV